MPIASQKNTAAASSSQHRPQCSDEQKPHRYVEEAQTGAIGKEAAQRKSLVGSGDRSERIRTYNFPQGRVTDHRINLTLHRLPEILEGGGLDEVVAALIAEDEAARLAQLDG